MTTAFQPSAFQNDAFQIDDAGATPFFMQFGQEWKVTAEASLPPAPRKSAPKVVDEPYEPAYVGPSDQQLRAAEEAAQAAWCVREEQAFREQVRQEAIDELRAAMARSAEEEARAIEQRKQRFWVAATKLLLQ